MYWFLCQLSRKQIKGTHFGFVGKLKVSHVGSQSYSGTRNLIRRFIGHCILSIPNMKKELNYKGIFILSYMHLIQMKKIL